jgi:hypothetical protein
VANFDYGAWPGQADFLRATRAPSLAWPVIERIWLAQESRDLPGAERALYAALPLSDRAPWRLALPDAPQPGDSVPALSLATAFSRWPSGQWLVTARFHAALAGAWAGSKILILSTNEKLRAAARDLACPVLAPAADAGSLSHALTTLAHSTPVSRDRLILAADRATAACAAFVRAARSAVAPGHRTP